MGLELCQVGLPQGRVVVNDLVVELSNLDVTIANQVLEGSKVDTDNSVGGVGRERLESPNLVGALHQRVDQRWVRSEGGVDPEFLVSEVCEVRRSERSRGRSQHLRR